MTPYLNPGEPENSTPRMCRQHVCVVQGHDLEEYVPHKLQGELHSSWAQSGAFPPSSWGGGTRAGKLWPLCVDQEMPRSHCCHAALQLVERAQLKDQRCLPSRKSQWKATDSGPGPFLLRSRDLQACVFSRSQEL